jgi:hypothetical protein
MQQEEELKTKFVCQITRVYEFVVIPNKFQTPKLVPLTLSAVSNWEAEILGPAAASVQRLLDGETVVAMPSDQLSKQQIVREANKSEPCREFCQVCQRLFVLRDQWEIHIKSNRHKRKLASRTKFEQKNKRLRATDPTEDKLSVQNSTKTK